MRRDEMRWKELRWGEKSSDEMRWDEGWNVKCKCEVWSAGCEDWSVQCEESSCLALHCLSHLTEASLNSSRLFYAFTQKDVYKILCSTKLAQSTSQYYFALQSLCKTHPNTTLHYKACAQYYSVLQSLHPVVLCTSKLARSSSQYYLVLQSLQKALPSTTLYYKARPL